LSTSYWLFIQTLAHLASLYIRVAPQILILRKVS